MKLGNESQPESPGLEETEKWLTCQKDKMTFLTFAWVSCSTILLELFYHWKGLNDKGLNGMSDIPSLNIMFSRLGPLWTYFQAVTPLQSRVKLCQWRAKHSLSHIGHGDNLKTFWCQLEQTPDWGLRIWDISYKAHWHIFSVFLTVQEITWMWPVTWQKAWRL